MIPDYVKDIVDYGFPILALVASTYSVITSRKASKMKDRVLELEKELKEIQLEKIHKEIEESEKACIEARIIKESKHNYKLKVWNSGNGIAYNVDFNEDCEESMIWRDKVPFEFLESGKNFEERISIYNGYPDKFIVKTIWNDKDGKQYTKDNIVSI